MIALAMMQGTSDTTVMLIAFAVFTLLAFVVLGAKFFVNLFEVVTAPGASLKHHGMNDTAFYSFAVVFLGHLIGSIVLVMNQSQMREGYARFATDYGTTLSMANGNKNYQDVAAGWASDVLNGLYTTTVESNLLWIGLIGMGLWIVGGLLYFLVSKMFGSPVALTDLLGSTAYPMFFMTIGLCCYLASMFNNMDAFGDGFKPAALMGSDPLFFVGAVLILYSLVLYAIGFLQASDLGFGQLIIGIIVYIVVVGGISYLVLVRAINPAVDQFKTDVRSMDFSKNNYTPPGASNL